MSLIDKKIKTELAKILYKDSFVMSPVAQTKTKLTGRYVDISKIEDLFGLNIFGNEDK